MASMESSAGRMCSLFVFFFLVFLSHFSSGSVHAASPESPRPPSTQTQVPSASAGDSPSTTPLPKDSSSGEPSSVAPLVAPKPKRQRTPRPPPPPVPPEDSIVLNPSHFGIYIHPAGHPIQFAEESMDGPPAGNETQDSRPASLPSPDIAPPPPPTEPASPATALAPHILPRPAPAGIVSFPGDTSSEGKVEVNEQSLGGEASGEDSLLLSSQEKQLGTKDDETATGTVVERYDNSETKERNRDEIGDDILIDDPIYGDEKMYNAAGELIAIGDQPVSSESLQEGTSPSGDEEAGPMAPRPMHAPPLNALNGIVKIGFAHLNLSESPRDLRGSSRHSKTTIEIVEQ
ncbi:hypothetical protein CSUI_007360 [Cystoisospora suis]|uniref:Uncharacterized protein n=1 Tax=Cystoisospora suis TaxID=483139 RepID=A0A2C6KR69_9APIC|nr:hypothetical protein CSUI_007360 [Cystoisospora suis]